MRNGRPTTKEPNPRGELQRRVDAILDAAHDADWPRYALRVFLRCRQWASFDRCTFKVSVRTLAKHGVPMATASRGIAWLVAAKVFRPHGNAGACRMFEIVVPPPTQRPWRGNARSDRGSRKPWVEED
jgi:hypothetical protein